MRTFKTTPMFFLLLLVLVPAPAQAWFGWLDNLSGPGPFNGAEFDYKFLCFLNQPSRQQAFSDAAAFSRDNSGVLASFSKQLEAAFPVGLRTTPAGPSTQIRQSLVN